MSFRIEVKTVRGNILKFHKVISYEITKGDFVEFIDERTKEPKKFHSSRCDIEEEKND